MVFGATITIECFLAVWPLPSMVVQWFLVLLPSISTVFDGFGPFVKRCDGFDRSLWSNLRTSWHFSTLGRSRGEQGDLGIGQREAQPTPGSSEKRAQCTLLYNVCYCTMYSILILKLSSFNSNSAGWQGLFVCFQGFVCVFLFVRFYMFVSL